MIKWCIPPICFRNFLENHTPCQTKRQTHTEFLPKIGNKISSARPFLDENKAKPLPCWSPACNPVFSQILTYVSESRRRLEIVSFQMERDFRNLLVGAKLQEFKGTQR